MSEIIPFDRGRRAPPIVTDDHSARSYDECLERLARVVAEHDSNHLGEVARLIGRLAPPV